MSWLGAIYFITSAQNFFVKWQVTKICSRDSSASPQKDKLEIDLLQFF